MIHFICVVLRTTRKIHSGDNHDIAKHAIVMMRVGCRILIVYSRGKCDCLNQMVLQVFTGTIGKQFANEVHTTEWCLAQRKRKEILSLLKSLKIAGLLAFLSSH